MLCATPCPGSFSRPFFDAILLILVRKIDLVMGCMVLLLCLYAKRCPSSGGLLILRWLSRAFFGSTIPSCLAQKIFSPHSLAALVHGMKMTISLRLFRSRMPCWTSNTLTWVSGLKPSSFEMVASLSLAVPQKAVVRHACIATSFGSLVLRCLQILSRYSTVQGYFSFCYASLGDILLLALSRDSTLSSLILHFAPCMICHTLTL